MSRGVQGIVVAWLLAPALAWAEPAAPTIAAPPFELEWSAPDGCPDQAAVRSTIARHLGRDVDRELGAGLRVALTAAQQADGLWRTTIAFERAGDTTVRELGDATDCARAVDAAGLVIAIAIDPAVMFEPPVEPVPEPAPIPAPTPAPTPESTPIPAARRGVAAPPPVAEPRPPWALRGAIGLAAGPGFGELPRQGGLGRLHGALMGRAWRVELGGVFTGAPARSLDPGRITVVRWSVDARGCGIVRGGRRFEFVPCGGVEVGQSLAVSSGLVEDARRSDAWLGLVAAARAMVVLGPRLALFAEGDLVVPLQRREYRVAGQGVVHRVGPVVGALLAGVEVRFP